jgi:hypothetical protein
MGGWRGQQDVVSDSVTVVVVERFLNRLVCELYGANIHRVMARSTILEYEDKYEKILQGRFLSMFALHAFGVVDMVVRAKDAIKKSAFEDNEFTNNAYAVTTLSPQYIRATTHLEPSSPCSIAYCELRFSRV